jgi:hypothetical protein
MSLSRRTQLHESSDTNKNFERQMHCSSEKERERDPGEACLIA